MPIDSCHQQYTNWRGEWQKMRDVAQGQRAVQLRATGSAESYLPKLSRQTGDEYEAYKRRATFYGATGRTIEALCGAIFRHEPEVQASDVLREQLENVDLAETPFETFAKYTVGEVLTTGRYGILLDVPSESAPTELRRPYWVGYCAEDIINWHTMIVGGVSVLVRVVLRECVEEAGADEYQHQQVTMYRVLELESDTGLYRQRVLRQIPGQAGGYGVSETVYPTRVGERLAFVPFVFLSPISSTPIVQRPPLLDLADVNLAHWRKSVDYAHGLHFTALPTPWLADREAPTGTEFRIGSQTAWVLSENGSCGMMEFSGAGMTALKDAILDDEQRMARLGAELLTPDKREAESAEAKRITAASRTASLASLASTVSWALTRVASWHSWWLGESDEQQAATSIALNQRFTDTHLASNELTALVQARQAGEISRQTFLENLTRGEVLVGRTIEEELAEIEAEQDIRAERQALQEATSRTQEIGTAMMEQMRRNF